MKLDNITIGSDPELFIINKNTGKVVSSIGLIPGEKGNAWRGDDMPAGFGLETDNIVAEFNIPPVTNMQSFVNNIEYMKNYIKKFVSDKNKDLGIKCSASELVDPEQLNSKQAKLFGCDVDYNAWTESANPKPEGNRTNLRSCGFHIHIGYDTPNIDTSLRLVKYLDTYLGLPSLFMDNDTRRRSLYGKAGCFRLTSYGVEYRVLSSAMMRDERTLRIVWSYLSRAIREARNDGPYIDGETIQNIINNNNIELAKKALNSYGICVEFSE